MKTVLITGASRGIGKATALAFLKNGWKVIGTSTSGKSEYSDPNLEIHQLDLTSGESIANLTEHLKGKPIDVLINNAGVSLDFYEDRVLLENLRKTLEINLFGLIDLTEKTLELGLLNSGGKIINISSQSGSITQLSGAMMPAYKISKVALNMYTRTLARRLEKEEILVYSLDPGWVDSDMGSPEAPKSVTHAGEEIYDLAISNLPTDGFYKEGKLREW